MIKFKQLLNLLFVCLTLKQLIVNAEVNFEVADRKAYKIKLRILSEEKEIYFKRDGKRFLDEYTLKFLVQQPIRFIVDVRPTLPVQRVFVQGENTSILDLSKEMGSSTYSFTWISTQLDLKKRKNRTEVKILIEFRGGLKLVIPLQVKFYPKTDRQHLNWGTPLHNIEYDCQIKPGQTFVIAKTMYRSSGKLVPLPPKSVN